ncbi:TetR/AcrR family transcriptional regulator [Zobellia nedashkovskayae]|uniref:TetR/AcrR family transcriptional regulator n=1 Tax=Zobellia nedashkovskayae TaxID=2779510 RepID=UPI001D05933C|nr:TetR/AcrR family transcriptional regulator [Zobellia nedashkovskayae]
MIIRESVKDRIITAASELFYFDGYNQTGINKIIEEAQVSKDSMYRHFGSKEAIAVAYLEKRQRMISQEMTEFISAYSPGNDKIIGIFDYLLHWLGEVDFRGCGFQNIITDIPKDQESIKDAVRMYKNEVHEFIQNELNKTASEEMDTIEISNEVMVLIEGAIMLSQIQKNTWPLIAAKKACIKILKD